LELKSLKEKRKLRANLMTYSNNGLWAVLLSIMCLMMSCSSTATRNGDNARITTDKRIASTDVVKASPEPVQINAGASAETSIRLNIQAGYHVNANPPSFPYLKATEVQVPESEGISVGFIVYPDPLTKKFEFSDEPLAVYEGETIVKVNLKADKGAKPGKRELSAKLQVQACDDQVCYAPGVINFSIPADVK
jgi:DsbC/DsbD-like thiol-disulfide interchange protein